MSRNLRIATAVAFAVLWTAWMLWWSYPDRGVAHTVILATMGAILGVLWYWLFGWLFGLLFGRLSRPAD
jgi:hypothetical protein